MQEAAPELAEVRQMRERGFATFEGLYSDAELAVLRETMVRLHREAGEPSCFSRDVKHVRPEVEISPTGLVFYKFIKRCPEHTNAVVRRAVVDVVKGYLGADAVLELTGAVIADATRPFFTWHSHIGGIDDGVYRRGGNERRLEQPERVMTLLYIDGTRGDNGPLLIYPRIVGEPTRAPHDWQAEDWPGQVVAELAPGTVVMLDECTWHAVRRKTSPGLRSFVGCYFKSPRAPPTEWDDESLGAVRDPSPLLQSVLPR